MAGDDVAPGKYISLPYEGVEPAEQDDVIGRLKNNTSYNLPSLIIHSINMLSPTRAVTNLSPFSNENPFNMLYIYV